MNNNINLTITTCWYILKSKFSINKYEIWIKNLLYNVRNFYLIIYCNIESKKYIDDLLKNNNNNLIKIVVKEYHEFYNYKLKDYYIENHKKNYLLNNLIDWKLNMLWNEKIHFVYDTYINKYFNETDYYCWCDIGYFREDNYDVKQFPNYNIINNLNKQKIYYACINNNKSYIRDLIKIILDKNDKKLPKNPIPNNQLSIAGGFFITYKENILKWKNIFQEKLELYFLNNYLVKDDQIIIADCIFSNLNDFEILFENNNKYDNWFMFKRKLLKL